MAMLKVVMMTPLRGLCLWFHHQPLSRQTTALCLPGSLRLSPFFSLSFRLSPPYLPSLIPPPILKVSNSTHDLPDAGVVLEGVMVEALLLRDAVLGVDDAAAVGQKRELLAWHSEIVRRIIVRHDDRQLEGGRPQCAQSLEGRRVVEKLGAGGEKLTPS